MYLGTVRVGEAESRERDYWCRQFCFEVETETLWGHSKLHRRRR